MTAAEVATASEARARVDRIKTGVEVVWHLIVESYQARDWDALGYSSWDDMCTREFGTSRLRLPREERAETVRSLRENGLSLRAISTATGSSVTTIRRELSGVPNGTPVEPEPDVYDTAAERVNRETGEVFDAREVLDLVDDDDAIAELLAEEAEAVEQGADVDTPMVANKPIQGLDGKTYHRPQVSKKPPRKALTEVAKTRGFALRQAMDSVLKVTDDDRYAANEKQVADALRGHLLYVAETVAAVLDQLP